MTAAGPGIIQPPATDAIAAPRPTREGQSGYLPTLDGWRAVAILLVVIFHAFQTMRDAYGARAVAWLSPIVSHGRVGVYIFFGISGFLICTRLLGEYHSDERIDLKRFYIRRVHRILPPMIIYLLIVGILGLTGVLTIRLRDWIATTCFAANYIRGNGFYFQHFWTLAIEEHFYLLFPALLALAGSRRALWLTIGVALAVAVWRTIDLSLHVTEGILPLTWERTDGGCDGLLWGCAAAIIFHNPARRDQLTQCLRPATFWPLLAVFGLAIWGFEQSNHLARQSIGAIVMMMLVPTLLIATITHPHSVASRLLEWSPLRWIGRLSYSLYLWQQVFLIHHDFRAPLLGPIQRWPLNILCALAMAMMSYYIIEKPFIREGYRRTQ